ncbi:M1-specific T cell receptor alpha chain-like isoform X1 [Strigops habroptila]|uniref:M1-specific T cell receptor alpha chain-like isoform X1 n=1 Tax=Strigops habroptila TaxID=2489341 RepID=UPI0011D02E85|nr:M1-specific T cell receptor alpha chain-like isoform X1 [Strigops habroptila]
MDHETGFCCPWCRFPTLTTIQGRTWRNCGHRQRGFEGYLLVLSPALALCHMVRLSTSAPALGSFGLFSPFCCPSYKAWLGRGLGTDATSSSGLLGFLLWKEMLCDYGYGYNQQTFGSGTRLSVQPNVTPSPSVYRLISKDDEDLEMCLITDHSPEKLTLNWADKVTNTIVEVTTPENKQEASYLSTYWAKKDEMLCGANYDGFGELEGKDPESGSSAFCVTGVSLHFRTDENLNTMSLSQLGLKITLMKGIIFNVLMTMLMWKKKNESNQMVQS